MAEGDFNVKAIISADTKNFDNGMKKAQTSATNLSNTFGNLSKVITKALSFAGLTIGVKAITDFGKASVRAAEDANRALNVLNNTLKVTGATSWTTSEEMVKMSEEIAHSTNYTVGEIQDMQSVLLGFRNITDETFKEASEAVTDMATVMGMDLKSAVQTVGKALDDPVKGLDSLRRQGFAFTEEQKAELAQLVANGEQLKAQKIILDELSTTYGGAAKASQSSFDKQRDNALELKETLGNKLLPVFDVLSNKSADSIKGITEKIKTIDFSKIAAEVEYSVQIIKDYLQLFYDNIKELFRGITGQFDEASLNVETFKENIYNVLNTIYKQMQLSFGFMKALIKGDWKLAWEYAKLVVLEVCQKILDGLNDLLKKMPDLVNGAIKGLNKYYEMQDKVLIEWLHLPEKWVKAPRLGTYDGENYIDTSTLKSQIDEATRVIEEATNKQVTVNLTGLQQIDNNRKKYQKNAQKNEINLTNTIKVQVEKRMSIYDELFSTLKYQFSEFIKQLKKDSEDWSSVFSSIFSTMQNAFSEMFVMLGENLVGAGHGFENFASVALDALADVLKAIAAQLAALAVVKALTFDYAGAAAAAAAATAAGIASGVASGASKALEKTKDEVEAIGDAADKSTTSLDEFLKRLEDIKNGVTSTSRRLSENVKEYKDLTKSIKETLDAKYAEIEAERKRIGRLQKLYRENMENAYGDNYYHWKSLLEELEEPLKKLSNEYAEIEKAYEEAYEQSQKIAVDTLISYEEQIKENKKIIESYKDIYSSMKKYNELLDEYNKLTPQQKSKDLLYALINGDLNTYIAQLNELKRYVEILFNEQKLAIQESLVDVYDSLAYSGKNIGETLVDSIIAGGKKKDFLTSMKDYIRENLIKLTVYTESFQNKLAQVGVNITSALMGGGNLSAIRTELENIWEEANQNAQAVESVISEVFGDLVEETKDSLEEIEKELTRFEKAMNSFKDTISDLGGDLAINLIDGISNGLGEGEFLDDMKKWIRKMLVQSVVYTESMKAEIEAIGAAISKGISEGFTETTFHEIRRDLSWVFNQANQTMENIDSILNSVFGGGYANGTNNATRGIHLVGEAGPELVRFRGGEQVINAGNTQKALTRNVGNSNTFNVTFQNTQDTTAYAIIQELKAYNKQMAVNGIM